LILVVSVLFAGNLSIISKASDHSSLSLSDPLNVRIIHPEKEQGINIGSNLEITGTSGYKLDYTCHVSVIINDVKPYQEATPTGTKTKNDYTTWKYIVDPDYTNIKEGDNKITARLLCSDDRGQDLRKWYSVSITEQNVTESSHQSLSTTTLAVPITIGTESTATPTSS
jgi:hypothetical protein